MDGLILLLWFVFCSVMAIVGVRIGRAGHPHACYLLGFFSGLLSLAVRALVGQD